MYYSSPQLLQLQWVHLLQFTIFTLPIINPLSQHQSGSRALHSTVTALLEATDSWAHNIDIGNVNAVVFLDLKKAFDTVDHHILLSELHLYCITDVSHKWFSSLSNRTQKCVVNGSECCTLKCGIPQATILFTQLSFSLCAKNVCWWYPSDLFEW